MAYEETKRPKVSSPSVSFTSGETKQPGTPIGQRIQKIRGSLTRDQFAKSIGVSKRTLQRYEIENRHADSVCLEAICQRYGVNPTWLLLGEGEMYRRPVAALGVALVEGRGERSVEEMAERLGIEPEQLQRYEQSLERPGEDFIKRFLSIAEGDPVKLSSKLDFGVGMADLVAELRAEGASQPKPEQEPAEIDLQMLEDIIAGIEDFLRSNELYLPPEKKAKLIVVIYDDWQRHGEDEHKIAKLTDLCT